MCIEPNIILAKIHFKGCSFTVPIFFIFYIFLFIFCSSRHGWNVSQTSETAFVTTTKKKQDARVTLVCKEAEERWRWRAFGRISSSPIYPQSAVPLWYIFFYLCSHADTTQTVDLWHYSIAPALREPALTAWVQFIFRIYQQLQFSLEIVFTCSVALGNECTDNILTNGCASKEDFFLGLNGNVTLNRDKVQMDVLHSFLPGKFFLLVPNLVCQLN